MKRYKGKNHATTMFNARRVSQNNTYTDLVKHRLGIR